MSERDDFVPDSDSFNVVEKTSRRKGDGEKKKRPDMVLKVRRKDTKFWVPVGAAWWNEWGNRLSITLHPCVVLKDDDEILVALFTQGNYPPKKQDNG